MAEIDVTRYFEYRKVLSDRDYYTRCTSYTPNVCLNDLLIMIEAVCPEQADMLNNMLSPGLNSDEHKSGVTEAYEKRRAEAYRNMVQRDESGRLEEVEFATIQTMKFYADICFYSKRFDLLMQLGYACFNPSASIRFGEMEFPGDRDFPKTFESAYRMVHYDEMHTRDMITYNPSIQPSLGMVLQAFPDGKPVDFADAYAVYEYYKEFYIVSQNVNHGKHYETHADQDTERYRYYMTDGYNAESVSLDTKTGGVTLGAEGAKPGLSYDMSRYALRMDPAGKDTRAIRIALFDAIAETGVIPQVLVTEASRRYTLDEVVEQLGIDAFLDTCDAAFYMNHKHLSYQHFKAVRKIYDMAAITMQNK